MEKESVFLKNNDGELVEMKIFSEIQRLEWLISYYQNELIRLAEKLENAERRLEEERKLERKRTLSKADEKYF